MKFNLSSFINRNPADRLTKIVAPLPGIMADLKSYADERAFEANAMLDQAELVLKAAQEVAARKRDAAAEAVTLSKAASDYAEDIKGILRETEA